MSTVLGRRYLLGPRFAQPWICGTCRGLSTTPIRPAGHNKWSSIKHDKAKNDSAKSKERQIISKEIRQAVKSASLVLCPPFPGQWDSIDADCQQIMAPIRKRTPGLRLRSSTPNGAECLNRPLNTPLLKGEEYLRPAHLWSH